MPRFNVTVPIAGALEVVIVADSKADAIDKAFQVADGYLARDCQLLDTDHIVALELNSYERTLQGNVNYLTYTEATADNIDK